VDLQHNRGSVHIPISVVGWATKYKRYKLILWSCFKFQFSHICFLVFRRLKIQFGTHWGNVGGMCVRIGGRNTSLLEEQVGMLRCTLLKKFLAVANKQYCMNTDNNVAETTQRLKCWLGWQRVALCNNSKCLFVSCIWWSKCSTWKTD